MAVPCGSRLVARRSRNISTAPCGHGSVTRSSHVNELAISSDRRRLRALGLLGVWGRLLAPFLSCLHFGPSRLAGICRSSRLLPRRSSSLLQHSYDVGRGG